MSYDIWLEEDLGGPRGQKFEILKRENFGTKSKPCWVVDVRLPGGKVTAVHDPALPDFDECGQPQLCAKVRALWAEAGEPS